MGVSAVGRVDGGENLELRLRRGSGHSTHTKCRFTYGGAIHGR